MLAFLGGEEGGGGAEKSLTDVPGRVGYGESAGRAEGRARLPSTVEELLSDC